MYIYIYVYQGTFVIHSRLTETSGTHVDKISEHLENYTYLVQADIKLR
jgi:hypothetical protein